MAAPDPWAASWNIHNALQSWTATVDTKASFALTIETAVLGAIGALSTGHHRLANLHGPLTLTLLWVGIGLVGVGILAAIAAVTPVLHGRRTRSQASGNFVYFGHLRYQSVDDIRSALESDDLLLGLSRQLKVMSAIAWRKYRLVQVSMLSAASGAALTVLAGAVHSRG